VIPTRNRPEMVVAAVESALTQTSGLLEVIVVIDGPDPSTVIALTVFEADRLLGTLCVLALEAPVGGAEARNLGVKQARGTWIAFLDDDDLWLPNKLAVQLALAAASDLPDQVIASAVLARGPGLHATWPRQLYQPGQNMAEYLFCRKGWAYGAGLLQTSTLLVPRALMLRVPFAPGLKKHQDWDWLLRVGAAAGVSIRQSPEPLVVFHVEGTRPSVGRAPDWRFSQAWAHERRAWFTPRAFSSFLATECAPQAARAGATLAERVSLFGEVVGQGSPTLKLCVLCVGFLLVPQRMRRSLRNRWADLWRPQPARGRRSASALPRSSA
jgi:hypothetical protein